MHPLGGKLLFSDWDFTQLCSCGFHWQYARDYLDNDLALPDTKRRHHLPRVYLKTAQGNNIEVQIIMHPNQTYGTLHQGTFKIQSLTSNMYKALFTLIAPSNEMTWHLANIQERLTLTHRPLPLRQAANFKDIIVSSYSLISRMFIVKLHVVVPLVSITRVNVDPDT